MKKVKVIFLLILIAGFRNVYALTPASSDGQSFAVDNDTMLMVLIGIVWFFILILSGVVAASVFSYIKSIGRKELKNMNISKSELKKLMKEEQTPLEKAFGLLGYKK